MYNLINLCKHCTKKCKSTKNVCKEFKLDFSCCTCTHFDSVMCYECSSLDMYETSSDIEYWMNEKFICPSCSWASHDWCNIRSEITEAQTQCDKFTIENLEKKAKKELLDTLFNNVKTHAIALDVVDDDWDYDNDIVGYHDQKHQINSVIILNLLDIVDTIMKANNYSLSITELQSMIEEKLKTCNEWVERG